MRHICFFGVQIYNILQIVYKGSWNISLKKILRLQKWNSISSDTTFFNVLADVVSSPTVPGGWIFFGAHPSFKMSHRHKKKYTPISLRGDSYTTIQVVLIYSQLLFLRYTKQQSNKTRQERLVLSFQITRIQTNMCWSYLALKNPTKSWVHIF